MACVKCSDVLCKKNVNPCEKTVNYSTHMLKILLRLTAPRLKTQQKPTCSSWLHVWESQHILQQCEYSNRQKKCVLLWHLLEGSLLGINNSSSSRWESVMWMFVVLLQYLIFFVTQFAHCMALIQLISSLQFVKSKMCPLGSLENLKWQLRLSQKEAAVDSVPTA